MQRRSDRTDRHAGAGEIPNCFPIEQRQEAGMNGLQLRRRQADMGITQGGHGLVVVEDAAIGVDATVGGVFDSLVPVNRGANVQPCLSGCVRTGNAALTQTEVLRTAGPASFLGIDPGVDEPLVAASGMETNLARGEADLPQALERFEELGLLSLAVDPARRWSGRGIGHGCLLYTSDAADDLLCVDLGG